MKVLLFGKNGQVGHELSRSLQPLGEVITYGREEADFSNPESLRVIIQKERPGIIVDAAAYTAVDKAEEEENLALAINSESTKVLAEEALKANSLLVHYSTDYVFDGTGNKPYLETDKPNPINVYGRTKLAGEQAIIDSGCDYLIFRTSWVYASRGNNFLLTMLKLVKEREELSIVSDQIGAPTSAKLIADTTIFCVNQAMKEKQAGCFSSDLYHLTSSGSTSWHGFTEEIVKTARESRATKLNIKRVKAITTTDYPTPATRPMNSRLELSKLESTFSIKMPDWKDVLHECMKEISNKQVRGAAVPNN